MKKKIKKKSDLVLKNSSGKAKLMVMTVSSVARGGANWHLQQANTAKHCIEWSFFYYTTLA